MDSKQGNEKMAQATIGYAVRIDGRLSVRVGWSKAKMLSYFRNTTIVKVSYVYEGMGVVSNVKEMETL